MSVPHRSKQTRTRYQLTNKTIRTFWPRPKNLMTTSLRQQATAILTVRQMRLLQQQRTPWLTIQPTEQQTQISLKSLNLSVRQPWADSWLSLNGTKKNYRTSLTRRKLFSTRWMKPAESSLTTLITHQDRALKTVQQQPWLQ